VVRGALFAARGRKAGVKPCHGRTVCGDITAFRSSSIHFRCQRQALHRHKHLKFPAEATMFKSLLAATFFVSTLSLSPVLAQSTEPAAAAPAAEAPAATEAPAPKKMKHRTRAKRAAKPSKMSKMKRAPKKAAAPAAPAAAPAAQ
jgi:hypothetical protein